MKIGIIVVGFNRIEGLIRLLTSLDMAYYGEDQPALILSIDKSSNDEVESFANNYVWKHGEKIVRCFEENQGLKKHILSCGTFFDVFDELIVLEDDMFVSPSFYCFAKKCGEYYRECENIAGISLYQHLYSIDASEPFTPIQKGADVFFMKYAQSWGQVWLKNQWMDFKKWYDNNNEIFGEHPDLPENVCSWSKSSWLKYHIRYCVENNKYFVYPYTAQATCFSEAGVHSSHKTAKLQVPLQWGIKEDYSFVDFCMDNEKCVVYDQYFENVNLRKFFDKECDVDLLGRRRKFEHSLLLTTKQTDKKIVRSWGLELRPIEANVLQNIPGDMIYLYDTSVEQHNNFADDMVQRWHYNYRTDGMIRKEFYITVKAILNKIFRRN